MSITRRRQRIRTRFLRAKRTHLLQRNTFTRAGVFAHPDLCEGAPAQHDVPLVT